MRKLGDEKHWLGRSNLQPDSRSSGVNRTRRRRCRSLRLRDVQLSWQPPIGQCWRAVTPPGAAARWPGEMTTADNQRMLGLGRRRQKLAWVASPRVWPMMTLCSVSDYQCSGFLSTYRSLGHMTMSMTIDRQAYSPHCLSVDLHGDSEKTP